ncbi:MAG: VOC family protein [Rikenellaceae bacterium]
MKKLTVVLALCCIFGGAIEAQGQFNLPRPKITALAHGGYFTKDFDGTRDLFKDYFGFEEPVLMPNYEEGGYRFAFIKINEMQYVEIFPERSPTDNRMYHFSVVTEDAEGMRRYLQSQGFEVPETTPKGRTGNSNYFVTDPNGTICEIVEYEPDSMTSKAKGLYLPEDRISSRLGHVGFVCPDLDKALSFYVDVLGFEEVWRSGGSPSNQVASVYLQLPEGDEYIELMVTDKELSWQEECNLNYLCLEVDDIYAVRELLSCRTLPEGCTGPTEISTNNNNKLYMDYFNVDGTRIQIMEK